MKRKAVSDSQPAAKRVKRTSHSTFSLQEMKQLLQLFNHLESQNSPNQTLDRCIFDAYQSLSKALNTENGSAAPAMDPSIEALVSNKTILPSNVFFEQMVQLKAQIKAFRLLSRDLALSPSISDLSHGVDNAHSWQRPYIDPLRTQNPSVCGAAKYNLRKQREAATVGPLDGTVLDSSPQTMEELVYQTEADGIAKLVDRRRMLRDFVARCDAEKASKGSAQTKRHFDVAMYRNARNELQDLELFELQCKVRNEVEHCRLDREVLEVDDAETEVLLNPDMFARTAKIGLQFEPHINSANHPPIMASSRELLPLYYEGNK